MLSRLTYANVISTIALFLALGLGGAWAAEQLKKNSVSSKQVKNESLVSKDLKNGKAVKGSDVAKESLTAANIKELSPAEAPQALALHNGVEADCIWTTAVNSGITPAPTPMSSKDALGRVSLQGVAAVADGPGGDGVCDPLPAAEGVEDMTIAALPPSQRPASSKFFSAGPTAGLLVVGVNGARVGFAAIAPGSVLAVPTPPPLSAPVLLDSATFQAADAAPMSGSDGAPDRISPKLLKSLGG